jgi:hypothetical protein
MISDEDLQRYALATGGQMARELLAARKCVELLRERQFITGEDGDGYNDDEVIAAIEAYDEACE